MKKYISEVYRPMAYCHGKVTQAKEKTIENYKLALEYYPNDVEALIEYGAQMIEIDPIKTLQSYEKAKVIMEKDPTAIIYPDIYNNIAVLQYQQKHYTESLVNFLKGITLAETLIKQP